MVKQDKEEHRGRAEHVETQLKQLVMTNTLKLAKQFKIQGMMKEAKI